VVRQLYSLASSSDPLSTLCVEHMLQHMELPQVVVVNLEEAICTTNWTQVSDKMVAIQDTMTVMIQAVWHFGFINSSLIFDVV
jgi:hypothetical protein